MNDLKSKCPEPAISKIREDPSPSNPAGHGSADWENRIAAYAAVGVAGACLLSALPDAEAKVVYTPAHVVMDQGTKFDLDVNHDGLVDFVFSNGGTTFGFIELFGVSPQNHLNAVVNEGICISSNLFPRNAPAALPAGHEIGNSSNSRPTASACDRFSITTSRAIGSR
jgi:hypothetical protein